MMMGLKSQASKKASELAALRSIVHLQVARKESEAAEPEAIDEEPPSKGAGKKGRN